MALIAYSVVYSIHFYVCFKSVWSCIHVAVPGLSECIVHPSGDVEAGSLARHFRSRRNSAERHPHYNWVY